MEENAWSYKLNLCSSAIEIAITKIKCRKIEKKAKKDIKRSKKAKKENINFYLINFEKIQEKSQ